MVSTWTFLELQFYQRVHTCTLQKNKKTWKKRANCFDSCRKYSLYTTHGRRWTTKRQMKKVVLNSHLSRERQLSYTSGFFLFSLITYMSILTFLSQNKMDFHVSMSLYNDNILWKNKRDDSLPNRLYTLFSW